MVGLPWLGSAGLESVAEEVPLSIDIAGDFTLEVPLSIDIAGDFTLVQFLARFLAPPGIDVNGGAGPDCPLPGGPSGR